jgi:hypothetical protein
VRDWKEKEVGWWGWRLAVAVAEAERRRRGGVECTFS